jgi:iron-sulfur cluster assembly protein
MITVTDHAAEQIQKLKNQESQPENAFLRVQVVGGGCSGMSYKMKFDTEVKENDKVFEKAGVRLVTDQKSYLYLIGTALDFSGGLNGKGFVFENPNAKKSCGCGSSFAV